GINLFNHYLELPIGPAAGPHTQLSQNIISSYLAGGRFFELKTVQILDELEIPRPCIDAEDEGYNVEWSQELKLEDSLSEYINAWILIHFLKKLLNLSDSTQSGIIFNMSVGYNLEGIQSSRLDNFINTLIDARLNGVWENKLQLIKKEIFDGRNSRIVKNILSQTTDKPSQLLDDLLDNIQNISPHISNSVTLSTMHGCPADEIEAIAKYLISEKNLNTYVKLNPTLLGYDKVNSILKNLGYDYIELDIKSFEHDLSYESAIPMVKKLQSFADENGVQFGVKLSNTLGVFNYKGKLSGEQMYLSGRALFPITINLASKLAADLNGNLQISFSGGINSQNAADVLSTGIYPITIVTDLLKPGGYYRLFEIAKGVERLESISMEKIDTVKLQNLADESLKKKIYHKESRETSSLKLLTELT
ncbi:MAG: putative selenate reductase subunit YgfK, partial [Ignavibacteria bacterium]|nr:putative selenate reductase subunit YgfK [Ignavibacteria bacterium]